MRAQTNTMSKFKKLLTLPAVFIGFLLLLASPLSNAVEQVKYYHHDALGSTIAATDEQGALLWKEAYRPFGDRYRQEDNDSNSLWYSGKPRDALTGLDYFGARWYDPTIGRFMGIDPAPIDPASVHLVNRYAYANNNPYKYVDPDGNLPFLVVFAIKELVSYGIESYTGVPLTAKGLAKSILKQGAKQGTKKLAKGGTYKLKDADGNVKRTGKSNNLDRRRSEHARNKDTKDLDFVVDRRADNPMAQRGREQIIYDKHPEAKSVNGGLNKRRPISPNNPRRNKYLKAGKKL